MADEHDDMVMDETLAVDNVVPFSADVPRPKSKLDEMAEQWQVNQSNRLGHKGKPKLSKRDGGKIGGPRTVVAKGKRKREIELKTKQEWTAAGPRKFKAAVEKYFADREADGKPLTFSGLGRELKVGRETLFEFEFHDNAEIRKVAADALRRVEEFYEGLLSSNKPIGGIYALKSNRGWPDDKTIHLALEKRVITQMAAALKGLSPEALDKVAELVE